MGSILGDAIVPVECRQEHISSWQDWLFLVVGSLLLVASVRFLGLTMWRRPSDMLPHAWKFRHAGVVMICVSTLVAVPSYYAVLAQGMLSDSCGGANESSYDQSALLALVVSAALLLLGVVLLGIGLVRGGPTQAIVDLPGEEVKEPSGVDV